MKILFCDNTLWGLVNFREPIFKHFHEQGHKIVLVAPETNGIAMNRPIPDYARYIPIHMRRTGTNPFADLGYMLALRRIYKKERPDCIFHYTIKPNIYGTLIARSLHIKSAAMVAGLGYAFERTGFVGYISKLLYRYSMRFAHKVFVLNEENYTRLLQLKITAPNKLELLRGGEGVDLEKFSSPHPVSPSRVTFLMVARILYDKGYSEFLAAARAVKSRHTEVEFCLLGPIDERYPNAVSRQTIEADAATGAFRYLEFTGKPEEIMGSKGFVIVVPSFYPEGLNRSLMEACALGRPIITTDIAGCREMVEPGKNGYIVPPKDSKALSIAMEQYLSLNDTERQRMGDYSRKLAVSRFNIQDVFCAYDRILSTPY